MPKHAPAPFDWQASGKPGSNGLFNVYVTDKSGRKIAAVWGKPGEKEATANLFVASPGLLDLLGRYTAWAESALRDDHDSTDCLNGEDGKDGWTDLKAIIDDTKALMTKMGKKRP